MPWASLIILIVAVGLLWQALWALLPMLVGLLIGIGLQNRFPRLADTLGDVIENLRQPAGSRSVTVSRPHKSRRK
jgi:hypothetical protein